MTTRAIAGLTTLTLSLGLVPVSRGDSPVRLTTRALSNQAAPGFGDGTILKAVADPRLDPDGGMAFWSRLAGGTVTLTTDTSLWSDNGIALPRAREGEAAASGSGVYLHMTTPAISGGDLAFVAAVGTGALNEITKPGAFASYDGAAFIVERQPQTGKQTPTRIQVANGSVSYRLDDMLVLRLGAQTLTAGHAAPIGPYTDATFAFLGEPSVDPTTGDSAFRAILRGTGIPTDGLGASFAVINGVLTPGVYVGQDLTGGGVLVSQIWTRPIINAASDFYAPATLAGTGVTAANDVAIMSGTGTIVLREGDAAPGVAGAVIASLVSPLLPAGDGFITIVTMSGAGIDAASNRALLQWSASGGASLVAREGESPDFFAPGEVIAQVGQSAGASDGRVAALVSIDGAGVTYANDEALIGTDASGAPRLIARVGAAIDVGTNDIRTISRIIFEPIASSVAPGGRVAMKLAFTDGSSGLFEANVPACGPDFNADGFVSGDDFDAFIAAFEAGEIEADYITDGFVNGDDFDAFAADFEAGC